MNWSRQPKSWSPQAWEKRNLHSAVFQRWGGRTQTLSKAPEWSWSALSSRKKKAWEVPSPALMFFPVALQLETPGTWQGWDPVIMWRKSPATHCTGSYRCWVAPDLLVWAQLTCQHSSLFACCRWPCFGRGVGLDDPQRSLPTPNILWFCVIL